MDSLNLPRAVKESVVSASPSIIVFDVNETLSDMSPLSGLFEEVAAPGTMAELWFTTLLRDL